MSRLAYGFFPEWTLTGKQSVAGYENSMRWRRRTLKVTPVEAWACDRPGKSNGCSSARPRREGQRRVLSLTVLLTKRIRSGGKFQWREKSWELRGAGPVQFWWWVSFRVRRHSG